MIGMSADTVVVCWIASRPGKQRALAATRLSGASAPPSRVRTQIKPQSFTANNTSTGGFGWVNPFVVRVSRRRAGCRFR